jgi:hypothetical protein
MVKQNIFTIQYGPICGPQSPRGLRHEVSLPAEALDSWVRTRLQTCMSCVYVEAWRWAVPPSKEPYRLCIGLRNWKRRQGSTMGCRAIDEWKKILYETQDKYRNEILYETQDKYRNEILYETQDKYRNEILYETQDKYLTRWSCVPMLIHSILAGMRVLCRESECVLSRPWCGAATECEIASLVPLCSHVTLFHCPDNHISSRRNSTY